MWFCTMSRSAPDLVVVAGPAPDPDVFGDGDLHALHPVAVPQRLEDRVREPEDKQVLDGLLPQVMINPVDLSPRRSDGEWSR